MSALITKMRDTRTEVARPPHTTFPLAATLYLLETGSNAG